MKNKSTVKSHIKIYWLCLAILIIVLAITLFFSADTTESFRFRIFMTYAFSAWIPLIFLLFGEHVRLLRHIEKNYPEEFKKLYSRPYFGMHEQRSLSFSFLFSKNDLGDTNVKIMKFDIRGVMLSGPIVLLSVIIIFVFAIVL